MPSTVTVPFELTVKVTLLLLSLYPAGAIVSSRVYVPASRDIFLIVPSDTHLVTSVLPFLITRVAPFTSLLPVISCFDIFTSTLEGSAVNVNFAASLEYA